jgi:hypothetical protein
MNDQRNENVPSLSSVQSRAHSLISHVIDGDVSDDQWGEFEQLAQANPLLWRELAESQRDHASLTMAMDEASHVAQRVSVSMAAGEPEQCIEGTQNRLRLNRASAWSGWAVAALIAIVASTKIAQFEQPLGSGEYRSRATVLNSLTPDESYQHYLKKGRESGQVVGEMPAMVMVETRQAPSGQGYEVLYLRQVLERTVVPDLYQVNGQTEYGQPMLTPLRQPSPNPM